MTITGTIATAQDNNLYVPGAENDTFPKKEIYLKEVTVVGRNSRADIHQLPEIVGTNIFAGKKNSLIVVENLNANIVTNTMRQIVAKVPGIHIWESDGSGIQIGIATRGLSPNRSWEFNVRQNGYDISADPFGYPEAYYTPQLQAVQRVQFVRGAGALQYGPQFGGMVNFILRDGSEIIKPFQFESQNTGGSFGLFNSYNAIGGQSKKINYFAFYDHRSADGWRENSRYKVNTGFATVHYKITEKFNLGLEYMRWNMRSQQPGGLSDAQFAQNARQSFRSRNWMNIDWHTAAFTADYNFNDNNRLNIKLFTVLGDRGSVGYLKDINIKDSINPATLVYNNRTVDIDKYKNLGAEARTLTDYRIGKMQNTLSAGIRYFRGITDRFKNGTGTTGSGYDETISGQFPSDIDLNTSNTAAFAENILRVTDKLIFIPGVRVEHITTRADGRLTFNSNGTAEYVRGESRTRSFTLFGIGAEYHIKGTEFYGNYTQAYRPMLFSDLSASPTTDVIDPDLKDSKGYSIDLGYRGKADDYLFFDVGVFSLKYNNRIGTITQLRPDLSSYTYRTNVANSSSKGVEALVEFNPVKALFSNSRWGSIIVFTSYAYTHARYRNFKVVKKEGNNLVETNLRNNIVENAPGNILRAGITYLFKGLSISSQWSHVDKVFTDANNTVAPTSNGQTGLVPGYTLLDIAATYRVGEKYNLRAGVNNVTDKKYFTRRASGYPGPGLMPSDARNFFVSVGVKL